MSQENGWPAPLAGVLNPIDDPYAAAQQMAVAAVSSGRLALPEKPDDVAEFLVKFQRTLTQEYLKLRDAYDRSNP
ncbi:hypothetical protein HMPREF3289_01175 [Pseudomonas sp. HMSC75E02]|uniref:hypothetical protein n=1 Tax=Pseudomonas sp. HMSC75E02 TaxID=1608908 RepID=UPI0008A94DCC|nr:hypothetical protein [Pseudomonas sp. HMSC75E02]OHS09307.1 hypothetical protein HMPREF3289_01175 [Pseudomonas sp. HMSC75E02]